MAEHGLAVGDQAGLQRVAVRPAAGRGRRRRAARATGQPLPRPHRRGAARALRRPRRRRTPSAWRSAPGSVGLLEQLALAYVDPGDEVVYPWPSFERLPQFTRLAGGVESTVPLRRQTFDADADRRSDHRAHPRSCSSPTRTTRRDGAAHRRPAALVDAAPPLPRRGRRGLPRVRHRRRRPRRHRPARDRPNVAVLRTLSRPTASPGCASASSSADPAVVDAVNTCAIPFGVNAAAQAAALAALDQRRRGRPPVRRHRPPSGPGSPRQLRAAASACRRARPTSCGCRRATRGDARPRARAARRRHPPARRRRPGHDRRTATRTTGSSTPSTTRAADPTLDRRLGSCDRCHAADAARLARPPRRRRSPGSRAHLDRRPPGPHRPGPRRGRAWDDRQVWAHVAEFGDYWLAS